MQILEDKVRPWLESAQFAKKSPGVFVLYDRHKKPIYIGASENLQKTFIHYLDTSFGKNPCMEKTWFYQREVVDDPEEAKNRLLEEYKRENGTNPPCNSEENQN